jgi:hypothetical protein
MDTIEVTGNAIRITKANGMSTAQITKILQGIKQYYSFPIEVKSSRGVKTCNCKTHMRRRSSGDFGK